MPIRFHTADDQSAFIALSVAEYIDQSTEDDRTGTPYPVQTVQYMAITACDRPRRSWHSEIINRYGDKGVMYLITPHPSIIQDSVSTDSTAAYQGAAVNDDSPLNALTKKFSKELVRNRMCSERFQKRNYFILPEINAFMETLTFRSGAEAQSITVTGNEGIEFWLFGADIEQAKKIGQLLVRTLATNQAISPQFHSALTTQIAKLKQPVNPSRPTSLLADVRIGPQSVYSR